MRGLILTLTLILFYDYVVTEDVIAIDFVKNFVKNEQKPTFLICMGLCWRKNVQISLQKQLSKENIRLSTHFQHNSKYYDQHLLFFVDFNCPKTNDILKGSTHFGFPFRWLALGNSSDDQMKAFLEELPLLADSDFVLAGRVGDSYTITDLHKSTPSGSLIYTPRGHYNGNLVDSRPHRELFRRRRDVRGHPLTMANVIQDSNSTQYHLPREDRLEPHFDATAKIAWSTVRLAFLMLNATPRYIFSHRWGYKQNGKWSGMIDDINTGRADLGTNCVANTERLPIVTYVDTIAPYKVKFIFRQPPLPYVTNIFSLPFSSTVWIALAACTVISSLTIYLASKWEVRQGQSPAQLDGTIGDAMLLTMSALSQQGCAMEPRRLSGRIMLLVVFTSLMALYAAYSANIMVLLQAPSNAIQTLEQLANSKITIAANDVDYNHFVFRLYKDPLRILIQKRLEPERGMAQFYDINEGVERIRQGLFAFHSIVEPVYRQIERTFLQQEKCDLVEVDYLKGFDPVVPVKKDSPYLELLRVVFKQLHESGIQSALNKRLQVPKPRCADKVSSFSSVGLNDLRPVLIFMLYGFAVSIAIAVLEILYYKLKYRHIINVYIKRNNRQMAFIKRRKYY